MEINTFALLLELQEVSRSVLKYCRELEEVFSFQEPGKVASESELEAFANSGYKETVKHLLLASNKLGDLYIRQAEMESNHSPSMKYNIRMLRNMWEHREEKLIGPAGQWDDNKANTKWLNEKYGRNWSLCWSISKGQDGITIGELMPVAALRDEASHWLANF
jgi:hypothetical protein